jgi:hypothetical protein
MVASELFTVDGGECRVTCGCRYVSEKSEELARKSRLDALEK